MVIALALFIFFFGIVMASLAAAALWFRWRDERRARLRMERMRKLNMSFRPWREE